ncbi:DUF6491 family protein [Spongiibacter tropicus]|uniref:DUF6491 family protein n=1 Tax=Spongiibacter tropicus TaxID=454602 RepID=UPI0012F82D5F|nr:DUF6491 family protein [Spongiibacter tropicus]
MPRTTTIKAALGVALLSALAVACAPPERRPDLDSRLADIGLRPAEDLERLPRSGLESWQYLGPRQLLLIAREATYLLQLNESCQLHPESRLRLGGDADSFAAGDSLWMGPDRSCRAEQLSRMEKVGEAQ